MKEELYDEQGCEEFSEEFLTVIYEQSVQIFTNSKQVQTRAVYATLCNKGQQTL